jgi:hypothetical protein
MTPFICAVDAKLTRASLVIIERFEIKGNTNYYDLLITILDKVHFLCVADVRSRLPEQQRPALERRVGDGQPSLLIW